MGANLNPNVTAGLGDNQILAQGGTNNANSISPAVSLKLGASVLGTSEEEGSDRVGGASFLGSKPELQAPSKEAFDCLDEKIAVPSELKGVYGSDTVTRLEASTVALGELSQKLGDLSDPDFSKLDGDALALICLLGTQKGKEEFVNTLKSVLKSQIGKRDILQKDYLKRQTEIAEKQTKQIKEAKKARVRNIFKAILSVIGAIVAVAVAAAVTVATGAGGLAIAGLVLSIAGAACSITSAGLSIGAMYTENEEVKAKLAKANMAIGIAGAIFGIASSVCSGFASIGQAIEGVAKAIKTAADIASGLDSVAQGALDIADGALNIQAAKTQRQLENIKIEMEKINQNIETLNQLLEQVEGDLQEFIKNILECEQMAASELGRMNDAMLKLAAFQA